MKKGMPILKQIPPSSLVIKAAKVILSLWLVFHVLTMVIMPNANSFASRQFRDVVYPYSNVMGLTVGWSFFSPDPAHVLYLRYVVYFKDQDRESIEGYFPKEKNKAATDVRGKRDWTVMRFMLLDHKRLGVLMAPWICRQNPGAESVYLEYVMETVPPMDEAQSAVSKDIQDLSHDLQFIKVDHNCEGEQDDVLL